MDARAKSSVQLQTDLCREIVAELGPTVMRDFHHPDTRRTLFTLAHVWGAIAAGFVLAGQVIGWPWPWAVPAGLALAAFMATRINALNVLVHEGSHHALAPERDTNDFLTNWGAGYWILFDTDSYRALHGDHHKYLNEERDPDRPLYDIARSRGRLLRQLLEDFFWISIARRALVYREHAGAANGDRSLAVHWLLKIVANALLLGVLALAYGPATGALVYGLFWVFPLFSLYPMIIRLRLITEHFAPEVFAESEAPVFVARTSVCGPLEHYLLGAQMDYHFEHHLFPGIPYHQLRALHDELVRRGFFDRDDVVVADHSLSGGYLHFWRRFLSSDWFGAAEGRAPASA